MKIEVGKKYELNNGEVHECTHMRGDDLISVDDFGYGPFVINDILYHQDGRFADADADHEYSVKREWTEGETGMLAELDVKPGDVVECVVSEGCFTQGKLYKVEENGSIEDDVGDAWRSVGRRLYMPESIFRIISRASDTPKTWGEMTNAEKGGIALGFVQGETVQCWQDGDTPEYWADITDPNWNDDCKFRIKPEPVRETVTGWWNGHNFHNKPNYGDRTHRITFTTTDGKPDLDSIKMEALG